jgi:hypothetical protein
MARKPDFIDLEKDIPTTPEDILVLRLLRENRPQPGSNYLEQFNMLPEIINNAKEILRQWTNEGKPFDLEELVKACRARSEGAASE